MSEMELHAGTIKEVDTHGLTIEEWCQKECEKLGVINLGNFYDSYLEALMDKTDYSKYVSVNNKLYVLNDIEYDDFYIREMYPNKDGSYSYIMGFYNGGTCLSECLEEKLKALK